MPDDGPKEDGLQYDRMVEEALRSVVGRSLKYAAKHGLTDNHHFYITFRTDGPGTQMPRRLLERHPSEMTIVLQYQFWDLEVSEEGFSVTLSFGEVPEKLVVPFSAVIAFADPSVQFGLQFDAATGEAATARSDSERNDADASPDEAANGAGEDKRKQDSDKVVSFDTFRRKQT
jgi:uncharacterized protein